MPLYHRKKSISATDRTDSYFTVIKTIGGAQTVNIVVGALLIFVGAQRTIVGVHLNIVGAQAPTKVYKLTPMILTPCGIKTRGDLPDSLTGAQTITEAGFCVQ